MNFDDFEVRAQWARVINDGCSAKIFGRPKTDNPHPANSDAYKAWEHGWERA